MDFNGFNLKSYFLYILDTSISSPPANKRVGRPTKPYTFEQAQNTMAKYHGFYVMVDFYTKYDQKLNFAASHPRQQSSALQAKLGDVITKRKWKKYAYITLLVETLLRQQKRLVKALPVPDNVKLSSKCNFPGVGRRLNYPLEIDELLT